MSLVLTAFYLFVKTFIDNPSAYASVNHIKFLFALHVCSHLIKLKLLAAECRLTGRTWLQNQLLHQPNKIRMTHRHHPSSKPTGESAPRPSALLPNTPNPWVYCFSSHSSPSFVVGHNSSGQWGSLVVHNHTNIPFVILSILLLSPTLAVLLS